MRQFTVRARASAGGARAAAMTLVTLLSIAGASPAQIDSHSKAPIDITADRAEVSSSTCVAIWRGSAEAVQDKSHLRADTITIYSRPRASQSKPKDGAAETRCGGADRIEADGHVYYMTDDQNARGDHAVYSQGRDEIVLTGDVVVVQGRNVARGARLTIKVSTHEATMEPVAGADGKPGRVRAVVYPDKTEAKPATASDARP